VPVTPTSGPMREELGSAAAVTVVLVLYASTVAMPATPQVQAAGSDDWARGIVVGHQSAAAAEPAETGRAASSEWDPVLNAHVSRKAVWPSEQPSFGRFLTPALLTKESELCSIGGCHANDTTVQGRFYFTAMLDTLVVGGATVRDRRHIIRSARAKGRNVGMLYTEASRSVGALHTGVSAGPPFDQNSIR
jgi:hypothetical protein